MKAFKINSSFLLMVVSVLTLLAISACDSDDSVTCPEDSSTEFVMMVESIEAQSQIAYGDTLWVTFSNIPLLDGCRSFDRLQFTNSDMDKRYVLMGKKKEGVPCPQMVTWINITIPVIDLEIGTNRLTVTNADNTYLEHFVEVSLP